MEKKKKRVLSIHAQAHRGSSQKRAILVLGLYKFQVIAYSLVHPCFPLQFLKSWTKSWPDPDLYQVLGAPVRQDRGALVEVALNTMDVQLLSQTSTKG